MKRTVTLLVAAAILLGGCAAGRHRYEAQSQSVSASSVSGVVVDADVKEAMLEGVEISVADTTLRIGRVMLTRSRAVMADVTADSVAAGGAVSAAESESGPAAGSGRLLPWLLLLLILIVRFAGK